MTKPRLRTNMGWCRTSIEITSIVGGDIVPIAIVFGSTRKEAEYMAHEIVQCLNRRHVTLRGVLLEAWFGFWHAVRELAGSAYRLRQVDGHKAPIAFLLYSIAGRAVERDGDLYRRIA